jgi:hypothetical protein
VPVCFGPSGWARPILIYARGAVSSAPSLNEHVLEKGKLLAVLPEFLAIHASHGPSLEERCCRLDGIDNNQHTGRFLLSERDEFADEYSENQVL